MSAATTPSVTTAPVGPASLRGDQAGRPSFVGLVRGECFKLGRQWTTWILLTLLAGILFLPYLINLTVPHLKDTINQAPLVAMYTNMVRNLLFLRIFSGTALIIMTARLIGMEYSGGTIRIVLARGVGRLQLLAAKLTTLALAGLVILLAGLLYNALLTTGLLLLVTGKLDAYQALTGAFWSDTWLYIVTILINMAVTILMAAAVTVVSRSLAFGLSAGIGFFTVDNIGLVFFYLAYRLTGSNFWPLATGDLLGPNLNAMAKAIVPDRAHVISINSPYVPVTGGHTLLIAAIYSAVFLVAMLGLTWRRDVLE